MRKILLLLITLVFFACSEKQEEIIPVNENPKDTNRVEESYTHHTEWSYNRGIYEVNLRQYTAEGTFNAFANHLPRLKEMGVGIIWFMPIHPIGIENRLGSLGSYYSISDYEAVNPEFGSMQDFKNLVQEIHNQGMFVIIDWVANHTSWDNWLTVQHPDYYVTSGGNFIPPPGTNWSDVIELNYNNQDLRQYMINAMKFWVTDIGIDGFRCDAVDFVPLDFWKQANDSLKNTRPDLFMLAEGEGTKYHSNGFDMTYAWSLHGFGGGIMKAIYNGAKNVFSLDNFLVQELRDYSNNYRMYFTDNHDENSWEGTVFEQFGESAETFAALTHTLYGMPMIYSGQESGLNKRLQFFDKDEIPWINHEFSNLYTSLLDLKENNEALWNGEAGGNPIKINTTSSSQIFAFYREKNNDRVVAIFNLSKNSATVEFSTDSFAGTFNEFPGSTTHTFSGTESLTLEPWEYKIFEKTVE